MPKRVLLTNDDGSFAVNYREDLESFTLREE
jgi:broad specificity polyphosphatase/5'/3'-nucleotidase SurE